MGKRRSRMPGLDLQPHDKLDLSVVITTLVEPRFQHSVDRAREPPAT